MIYFFIDKKKHLLLLSFAFIALSFSSCLKKDIEALTTDLQVEVKFRDRYGSADSVGNVSGIKVVLYKSQADMEARVRPVKTEYTNSTGIVIFKGLEPFNYYIHASTDNNVRYYDNGRNNNSLGDVLAEGALTIITIPISYQRVSNPTKFRLEYATVLNYKLYSSTCSKELRIKATDYANTTRYDSTYYSDNYNYDAGYYEFSYCKANRFAKLYFKRLQLQTNIGYYFRVGEDFKPADVFTYPLYYVDYFYFYPGYYAKNNPYGYPEYPTRIRLWEETDKTIDINVIWQ